MLRVKTKITEMKYVPLKNEERKQHARSSTDRLTVNTGQLPSPVNGIVVTTEIDRSYIALASVLSNARSGDAEFLYDSFPFSRMISRFETTLDGLRFINLMYRLFACVVRYIIALHIYLF